MAKKIAKDSGEFHPFTVAMHNKRVVFIYGVKTAAKMGIFLSQSDNNGSDFLGEYELNMVSANGKKEQLADCDALSFFAYGNEYHLMYSRTIRGERQVTIARSNDMFHFKAAKEVVELPDMISVVSNHKYKQNFLAYYGGKSIYVAASKNLAQWHSSGALLSSRKGCFDDDALEVIGTSIIERGILVLYKVKSDKHTDHKIKIGAALFSFTKPYLLIWRSEVPIWEETIKKESYPERFLGSVVIGSLLYIYWSSFKNEIFSRNINLASFGLARLKDMKQLEKNPSNPILEPKTVNKWERDATFNPAALNLNNKIHLLYRAIGENGVSVLGYASSNDGFTINERLDDPVFAPIKPLESSKKNELLSSLYMSGGSWAGCEDPRMTNIDNRIYMTYVTFDGYSPPGVALTSISVSDFLNKVWKWKHPILISKPGEIHKNWMIFPEKIKGKYAILHSITPKISIEYVDNLDDNEIIIESIKMPGTDEHRWDNIVRGAGAPPIMTKHGWLVLYHAMDRQDPNKYKVGAMLLDHDDPTKILHRSKYPILEPFESYENNGAKSGVVYVCGAVIKENTLFVYYGGADSVVCVATKNIDEFLEDLIKQAESEPSLLKKINKPNHT